MNRDIHSALEEARTGLRELRILLRYDMLAWNDGAERAANLRAIVHGLARAYVLTKGRSPRKLERRVQREPYEAILRDQGGDAYLCSIHLRFDPDRVYMEENDTGMLFFPVKKPFEGSGPYIAVGMTVREAIAAGLVVPELPEHTTFER